ncbi:type II secretion system protein GspM [Massilia sp. SM-13]|uniref:type II secretion system protein GspM n=1 Tax=Pseudoduganella rhizocola TaxID=3382643 RepID=UPI0038B5C561
MKEQWLKLAARIDALALRERVMIFSALAIGIVYVVYMVLAEPLVTRQRLAAEQTAAQQRQIAEMNSQIRERIGSAMVDPDTAARARLEGLLAQQTALGVSLRTVQRGLVAPEKMAPLLEQILQANGRLKLMSLRSVPVSTVNEAAPLAALTDAPETTGAPADLAKAAVESATQQAAQMRNTSNAVNAAVATGGASAAAASAPAVPAPKAREMLYRHGVEIVLQGSYLDMVAYMEALERLPVQLFWGKAQLEAGSYPVAKLTLTLYTLSLDDKWMKL